MSMNDKGSDKAVCWLCDYWWVILLIIALVLVIYFTKDLWLPLFVV